ncbi:MAG: bifunctional demethylmenaquinone methyltransferase/2-methoxy-6-polyprenyl-1,4-benzoquinol methylase UbiE [Planctomycetes bacterium]|nr:bifunctional demethylmenaquinone methyltransferase/2-methoxy-6-polyprenyl-1,4-benzoquinol methylase UbiE [Planctomycetota bacterium]
MAAPPGQEIQAMFGEIAPRYDFLNRLLSFGIDRAWRRRTIATLNLPQGSEVLDLCCGTGDLALAFADSGAAVCGADFTLPMLQAALRKGHKQEQTVRWLQADAQALPFADNSFDAVTIAFGIRNVEDPQRGLRECRRVLRPGGRLAILEFFPIPNPIWRGMFRFYFLHVLPLIAKVVRAGRTGAYRYLPESVDNFATPEEFRQWMEETGMHFEKDLALTGGVARLLIARKEFAES